MSYKMQVHRYWIRSSFTFSRFWCLGQPPFLSAWTDALISARDVYGGDVSIEIARLPVLIRRQDLS
jgi:hypothetical protein